MGFVNIERLIALRTARGWDQKRLSDVAGIDRSVISRLERGLQTDCRVSVLIALAAALETPIGDLIRYSDPPTDHSPDLEAAVSRLQQQPLMVQRWAANIISAFLKGLENQRS